MQTWLKLKTPKVVMDFASVSFLMLFSYAAIAKLVDYEKFIMDLSKSPFLIGVYQWMWWFVPAVEILICILLIIKKTKLFGLILSVGLMLNFTIYIYAILNYSDNIPCSCGGILQNMTWSEHMLFNLFFVIVGLLAILLENKSQNPDSTNDFKICHDKFQD